MKLYKEINKNPSIAWITEKIIDRRINSEYYDVSNLSQSEKLSSMEYISKYFDLSKKRFDPNKYKKQTFKYIDISNVDINTGKYEISVIDKFEAPSRARKKVDKGDILISTVRPNRNAVAIISENDEGLVASTGFAVLLSKDNIDRYYSFAALKNQFTIKQLIRKASGGMYPAIAEEEVMSLKIPIPSPEIQKYIGDKVRRAEELREESKLLREEAENIIKVQLLLDKNQSLYNNNAGNPSLEFTKYPINLFVKPKDITERIDSKSYHPEYFETLDFLNNNKFKVMKLYNVIEDYSTGISSPKYTDDGIRILMTKNIKNDAIDLECKLVNRKVETKYRVNYGDVLITTYGGPSIGKVDIFTSKEECVYDYTILKLKFKSDYNPFFMTLLLRSKLIQNQIRNLIKGTTGITFVIPKEILNINIPIFDKDIQDEVGDIYKKSLECIDISKQLIQEAKQDVEDLIEGNFDMSKLNETTTESR